MVDIAKMKELFRNESIWQAYLLHTLDCVLDVNFKTHEIFCSASLVQSLRLAPHALPRTLEQWLELYHPDDYAKTLEFNSRVFEGTENAFSLERKLYCGDGVYRQFRMNAVCIRGRKNEIKRLIAVEADISEQKRDYTELTDRLQALENEISLLKSKNTYLTTKLSQKNLREGALEKRIYLMARMLDATPDFLFHCDEAGHVLICNEAFSNAVACNPDLVSWAAGLSTTDRHTDEERRYDDAHGRTRGLVAESTAVSLDSGDGYVGVARDITEMEEMLEDIGRLKRLLGKYSLTHETEEAQTPAHEAEADTEPNGINLNAVLEARLQKTFQAFSSVAEFFPTRAAQLESLAGSARDAELEVGVIGITSSGKSAFINAMMGEMLLPEETRVTTNLVIRCRKGRERTVTVISRDNERTIVSGPQLTSTWMKNIASERFNPENELNVAFLEWSSPGAALPEGLVLVDTPGLDACGFPGQSELVLRRLLPNLDIILYVTSIRNRFKTADLELLETALEHDQRVIFLLSQIDLEQDDMEGGKVVLSRRQKLSSYVRELYQDIDSNFPEDSYLRRSAVIAVSSKLAAAYFYDRESEAWKASNFSTLIGQLETYRSNLNRCKFEARARRALVLLSRAASDVELAIGRLSTEKAGADESLRLAKVRELRDAQRWANAEISAVRNEWRRQLDLKYHMRRLEKEIAMINTVKGIKDRYERWDEEWMELVTQMTNRMDRARRSCRDILHKHGISPEDRGSGTIAVDSELPAFYQYVINEAQEVRVRGWFETLEFWPRYSVFFKQKVNKDKMMEDVKELITERLRLLNDHLSWWENRMREDYCDLLYGELSREDVALADTRRAVSETSVSYKTLYKALQDIKEASRGIKDALADLTLSGGFDMEWGRNEDESMTDAVAISQNSENTVDGGLFAPLLASLQEQNIQSRFMEMEALRRRKRIVLLGLRRHDSLRLLSRLVHDATFLGSMKTEDGRNIDERDWIFRGSIPPALSHVKVSLPETLLHEIDILIAPSDSICASDDSFSVDWNDLFAEWLPVVHVDIARIDSGLSDLTRAPYADALAHVDHWVAASGQGALFNARLADLLTDVPERLDLFTRRRNYKGRIEWFVYENYDARYTDFMIWGQNMAWGSDSDDGSFLRKWLSSGHDFKFPFSEFRMRLAIEGARRKSMRAGSAPLGLKLT